MTGINAAIVKKAFKDFEKQMNDAILNEVYSYAKTLVLKAQDFRFMDNNAHNFTGNLLDSIVAAVYYNKSLKKAFFSDELGIKKPRYYEMTASHGRYYFKFDYSGKTSVYKPEIETGRTKGIDDANRFVRSYSPKIDGFLVVVAYTTAYASFVEAERGTTGYLNTFKYAEKLGVETFQLPSKAA